jgi:hypothetical protein
MKAMARPAVILRWTKNLLRLQRRRRPRASDRQPLRREPLGLRPGDRVRVLSRAEIDVTLGQDGTCRGLGYIPEVMDRYVGCTLMVRRRVGRFFDERNQRLLKLKDVVILEGSFCEPARDTESPFAGCDRSCYLFWKEDWLESMDEAAPGAPPTDGEAQ